MQTKHWIIGLLGTGLLVGISILGINFYKQKQMIGVYYNTQSTNSISGKFGINTTSPIGTLSVVSQPGVSPVVAVASSTSNTNYLTILANGMVGVGTNAPSGFLTAITPAQGASAIIAGDATNYTLNIGYDGAVGGGMMRGLSGSRFSLGANNTDIIYMTTAGLVGIGSTTPIGLLSVGNKFSVSSTGVVSAAGGVKDAVICWKNTSTLGYCSAVVGVGGLCTCN